MEPERPPVPYSTAALAEPDRFCWAAVPDPDWRLDDTGRCRGGTAPGKRACGKPSVAVLFRTRYHRAGSRKVPWRYCAEHMYGRWTEDGRVMAWVLRETGAAGPQ